MYSLRLLRFLVFFLTTLAAADPICSSIFGKPSYNDCEDLATELWSSWPGDSIHPPLDVGTQFFSLPGAEVPQWARRYSRARRVELPKFAGHGKFHIYCAIVVGWLMAYD